MTRQGELAPIKTNHKRKRTYGARSPLRSSSTWSFDFPPWIQTNPIWTLIRRGRYGIKICGFGFWEWEREDEGVDGMDGRRSDELVGTTISGVEEGATNNE